MLGCTPRTSDSERLAWDRVCDPNKLLRDNGAPETSQKLDSKKMLLPLGYGSNKINQPPRAVKFLRTGLQENGDSPKKSPKVPELVPKNRTIMNKYVIFFRENIQLSFIQTLLSALSLICPASESLKLCQPYKSPQLELIF